MELIKQGGALREDKSEKVNYTLIPPKMLERVAKQFTKGQNTHGHFNWLKGDKRFMEMCMESAFRHFIQWRSGCKDEDHASAAVFNIFAYETLKDKLEGNLEDSMKEKLKDIVEEDLQSNQ